MTTRRITGTLTDAAGTPLAGYTLTFTAIGSTPATVAAGSAHRIALDASGGYDVALLPGRYTVTLTHPSAQAVSLGLAVVTAGPDVDLLTLLEAPALLPSAVQLLVDQALQAAQAAQQALDEVRAIAANPTLAAISTDPDNRLTTGSDDGLFVPELAADPLAYYILAKT